MKRSFAIFAAAALLLGVLTACGGTNSGGDGPAAEDTDGHSSATGELKTDPATGTRYTGKDDAPVVRYGNGYGNTNADKAYSNNATANATLHGSYASSTGTPAGVQTSAADTRYQKMLKNARVHDTDGFLLDGENACYNTLW